MTGLANQPCQWILVPVFANSSNLKQPTMTKFIALRYNGIINAINVCSFVSSKTAKFVAVFSLL